MNISDKLDLLMKLTGTKNVALAKAVSYDASYISRIRSGKRGLPDQAPFIVSLSVFMAKRIAKDPQIRQLIAESVIPSLLTAQTEDDIAGCVSDWLLQEESEISIGQLLTQIIKSSPRNSAASLPLPSNPVITAAEISKDGNRDAYEAFYGNAGKRQAVETFLSYVVACGGRHRLLLYSDESMRWLVEDSQFTCRWMQLLLAFIKTGGQVEIIHTVRRDIGEMLDAVEKWMPIYMTGAMTSYYNPMLRDSILRRTLFLAVPVDDSVSPEVSCEISSGIPHEMPSENTSEKASDISANSYLALVSDSIGDSTDGLLNLIIRDQQAASALVREYRMLYRLCRPLLKVFLPADDADVRQVEESLADGLMAVLPGNIRVLVHENRGALITSSASGTAFYVQEPNLTQAIAVFASDFNKKSENRNLQSST